MAQVHPWRELLGAGCALLLVTAIPAAAATLQMDWNGCGTGIHDVHVQPGGAYALYASVTGQTEPHRGYRLTVQLQSAQGDLPDAWRFDPAGCQGTAHFTAEFSAPNVFFRCPDFANAPISSGTTFFDFNGSSASFGVLHDYAPDQTDVNPGQRYFIAHFVFDQSNAAIGVDEVPATCDNLQAAMCLHVTEAAYIGIDGIEHPWSVVPDYLTAEGVGIAPGNCLATPAKASTWGLIKAQYRL